MQAKDAGLTEKNTKSIKGFVTSDIYPYDQKMIFVTGWLKEFGASEKDIMLSYFNECLRIATTNRDISDAHFLVMVLQEHLEELSKKLYETRGAIDLQKWPDLPSTKAETQAE